MVDMPLWLSLGLTALLAGALGWFLARLRASRRIAELGTTLDLERRSTQEKLGTLDKKISPRCRSRRSGEQPVVSPARQ